MPLIRVIILWIEGFLFYLLALSCLFGGVYAMHVAEMAKYRGRWRWHLANVHRRFLGVTGGCRRASLWLTLLLVLVVLMACFVIYLFFWWVLATSAFYANSRQAGPSCFALRDWRAWAVWPLVTNAISILYVPWGLRLAYIRLSLPGATTDVNVNGKLRQVPVTVRLMSGTALTCDLFQYELVAALRENILAQLSRLGTTGHCQIVFRGNILDDWQTIYETGIADAPDDVENPITAIVNSETTAAPIAAALIAPAPIAQKCCNHIATVTHVGFTLICMIVLLWFIVKHAQLLFVVQFKGCSERLLWCLGSVCV